MDASNCTNISGSASADSDILDKFYAVGEWIDLVIRVLGFVTNPMILIVLSRQKIGSKYVRNTFHAYVVCIYC